MARQWNHYDKAFERLLRLMRRPYVSVNETRRALVGDSSLKSMDFVVYSQQTANLLVDVKGRRSFGTGTSWQNWTTEEDVTSLMHWEEVFGSGFKALFVFAYELLEPRELKEHSLFWDFRGRRYAFYGVWAQDYARVMRTRSSSWKTVSLRSQDFREMRQPMMELL